MPLLQHGIWIHLLIRQLLIKEIFYFIFFISFLFFYFSLFYFHFFCFHQKSPSQVDGEASKSRGNLRPNPSNEEALTKTKGLLNTKKLSQIKSLLKTKKSLMNTKQRPGILPLLEHGCLREIYAHKEECPFFHSFVFLFNLLNL